MLLIGVWLWKRVATMVGLTLVGQLSRLLNRFECDGCGHELIQRNFSDVWKRKLCEKKAQAVVVTVTWGPGPVQWPFFRQCRNRAFSHT
jgi:ribosomal protein L37AE/L43A